MRKSGLMRGGDNRWETGLRLGLVLTNVFREISEEYVSTAA